MREFAGALMMECIAIDWSGAVTGEAARIWIARAIGGQLTALYAPGSRAATAEFLLARRREDAPCVVGLDFAFSVPRWWAETRQWSTVNDIWRAARNDGETWLRDCQPPFWGRPGARRPHDAAHGLRETELNWTAGQQPKSVFQVGGAGAVGTGSIRGMPMLLALRTAGWAVWPFDAPASHTLVEIYPRLFTGPVVKRSAAAREAHLDAHVDERNTVDSARLQLMINSEDAFDAGLSAIEMSRTIASAPLRTVRDATSRIEGRIWVPGAA